MDRFEAGQEQMQSDKDPMLANTLEQGGRDDDAHTAAARWEKEGGQRPPSGADQLPLLFSRIKSSTSKTRRLRYCSRASHRLGGTRLVVWAHARRRP